MDKKLFKAVKEKFQAEVVEDLQSQGYQNLGCDDDDLSLQVFFERKTNIDDLDDILSQQLYDKYFYEFEAEEFEEWWRFNGDSYEEEYKQNHKDTQNMLLDAFDEWSEKNGIQCDESFNDMLNIKQFIEITIDNYHEDRVEFIYNMHYEHDFNNEKFNEISKSVSIYEFHLDKMTEILNNQFDLNLSSTEQLLSNYLDIYEAKIARISKKITIN